MIKVTLKDGSQKEYSEGISIKEVAESISAGLARVALAGEVNGEVKDLATILDKDCNLSILTFDSEGGKNAYRHTTSHILAQAVKRLYPNVKLAIGPSIETGFYYDFDADKPFSVEDLEKIEKEMEKIVKEDLAMERFTLPRDEAIKFMEEKEEPYKVELIRDLPEGEIISFYKQGDFVDLCAGPHIPSTGKVKAFKLTQTAGAYWRGSEKNKMLQRIYGTSFPKKSELDEYIARVEEAKKRDHNKLGRELELFTTVDYIGQGLPILMPKGARVIQTLQRFVEDEEERRGYLLTKTPLMAKSDLYKVSGHWDHYREGMFVMGDENEENGEVFALRPMTCPFQFQVYLARLRSYRELPMRFNETSTLFRNESSGEMHGLIRVRQFTISEGHIACTPDQLEQEFADCIDLANFMLKTV
ncbi:MAG: threonyl-tRNA synthetase, partial [Clostridiales bacterium]|nr:threonyl-tRNA synthetase [Clostridiales bacterium]